MQNKFTWRELILFVLLIFSLTILLLIEPISQDLRYHVFADTRTILGIPNFYDVISNIPFTIVGVFGLSQVYIQRNNKNTWSWLILFLSIILVAAGSSYYHLNPNNQSLTWDRLPMAIGFMALFAIVVGDYIYPKLEQWLLLPMCLLGIFSVLYWNITDDLRIYVWVQFFSSGLLLIVIILYKPNTYITKYLIIAFIFYALSKVTEYFDHAIFSGANYVISGHTIKHLLAGTATFYFYLLLKYKKPIIS